MPGRTLATCGRWLAQHATPLSLLVFAALAVSPAVYRVWRAPYQVRIVKVALISAFSGPLQDRGSDDLAAVQVALQAADAPSKHSSHFYLLTAVDDRGESGAAAADQARALAADPGVGVVLCCTTQTALMSAQPLLGSRQVLLPLVFDAQPMDRAEATLAARQVGGGHVALISDVTYPADARSGDLLPAFRDAGFDVTVISVNFAGGSVPAQVAGEVLALQPQLVVLDAGLPASADLGRALRTAGVAAPLMGDDRVDGAEAAREMGGLQPWWYVSMDRATLLQSTPGDFVSSFVKAQGHQPSTQAILSYLQARSVMEVGVRRLNSSAIPVTLYGDGSGDYPPPAIASVTPATVSSGAVR